MSKVDQRECQMMTSQEIGVLQIETDQKGTKLVNPSERPFTDKADFIDFGVEEPFPSTLDSLPIPFVFSHIGHDLMIEADFARLFRIESAVGIEEGTRDDQP